VKNRVLWFTLTLTSLLCIFGWAAYSQYTPQPYVLEFTKEHDKTLLDANTYSLEKWGRSAEGGSYKDPIATVKNEKPIIIHQTEDLELIFEDAPVSVKCYLWDINTGSLAYKSLTGSVLNLAEFNVVSGDYAMEIHAKWENGYGLYNTRIFVNEK
jgi:hypothetical protein